MDAEDRFEHVLENLYKAAIGDVTWVSAAALINDMIQTTGHSLTYADMALGGEPEIHLARFFVGTQRRPDIEQLYFRDYYPRDEAVPRLYGLRDGELVYKSDLYTDEEKRTSAAYNEFRRTNKTQNGLFMALDGLDGCAVVLSFGDSAEREGWGHDQIQAIKRLAPHIRPVRAHPACDGGDGSRWARRLPIRQFARIRHAMADAQALGASLAELLENGRAGFIQLDRRGRILEANDRARDILLKRDGLRDEEGVLAAEIQGEDAEGQRLLAHALPLYGVQGAGGSMKITRRKAQAPLVLEIHAHLPYGNLGHGVRGRRQ